MITNRKKHRYYLLWEVHSSPMDILDVLLESRKFVSDALEVSGSSALRTAVRKTKEAEGVSASRE
jgi:hypothetical protein